jgi:hypothetical protein
MVSVGGCSVLGMREREGRVPRRADAETLRRREALAWEVRTQLAAAGLPIRAEGLGAEVGSGVDVVVDPLDDITGCGVYVGWDPAPVLRTAVLRVSVHTERGKRVLRHSSAVGEAMKGAMRTILTAGGFTVGDSPDPYAPDMLYVLGEPPTPLLDTLAS